ncbi:MAG: putative bifunctional diguanylate cyclase/phosphodiesterase [Halothiobacillaceae bacterium]
MNETNHPESPLNEALSQDEAGRFRLLRLLMDTSPDFMVIKDGAGRWLLANRAAEELFGMAPGAWAGKDDRALCSLCKPGQEQALIGCTDTDEAAWRSGRLSRLQEEIPMPDGDSRFFDVLKFPVFRDGDGARDVVIVIGRDVTERIQVERSLRVQATTDDLTSLVSRRHFFDLADEALGAWAAEGKQAAMVLLDVDHFKNINDTYGHAKGDDLLRQMADRLRALSPGVDLLARLGGDEFGLLVVLDESNPTRLTRQLEQIIHLAQDPFELGLVRVWVTVSMGVAFYPKDGARAIELMRAADSAMYESKARGRNNFSFYNTELARKVALKTRLLAALRESLDDEKFKLVYQLQQNARSLEVNGVEALLRWSPEEPDLACGPAEFIPLLEETGLIIEAGGWIFRQACQQAADWAGRIGTPVSVSVNVSAVQLHSPCFLERVRQALEASGLDAALLELEITETALIRDPDVASRALAEVKDLGVKLALDDFGTGYSSLSYLKRYSFDRLKIDKSFVQDCVSDGDDLEIVKAIIVMGHALGMEVIAEGVETTTQRDLLESLGCDLFQGYLIGRPAPPEELDSKLGVGLL